MKKLYEKVHLCKELFPTHRKTKLIPRGDGPIYVLEILSENAYRIYLLSEYQVHNTFNFCDLSPFSTSDNDDPSNWRTNFFQEGENDVFLIVPRPFAQSQARDLQIRRS